MFKSRFGYLLPLLIAVLSAATSATAQCGLTYICTPIYRTTDCTACKFSLDDSWRQYLVNQETIGLELTSRSKVTVTKVTYLFTTSSDAKLAEVTQFIKKPASLRQQVFALNEEARTAFEQHAKSNNRLTIKVTTPGGRQETFRVQLVAMKHQGL